MKNLIKVTHISLQEKGDHPQMRLYTPVFDPSAVERAIVPMEPLPQHDFYVFSPDVEDPNVSIAAQFKDGAVRRLEGDERDEVRRWIRGGLALQRVMLRASKVKP